MRRILNAVATMGVSSLLVVLLSAVRGKVLALEFGAQGIGALGILLTAAALASTAVGCGLSTSGVRAVAETEVTGRTDPVEIALVKGSVVLGLIGGVVSGLAWHFFGTNLLPVQAETMSIWLGLAVFATVALGGYAALLNGRGEVARLAGSNASGAAVATLAMVPLTFASERAGLIAAVVAPPWATFLFAWLLSRGSSQRVAQADRWRTQFLYLVRLGVPVSASLLLMSVVQFGSRLWVSRVLGIETAGLFQASWSIAGAYLGLLLGALATEYFPRIAALGGNLTAVNASALRQLGVVLTLGVPVVSWMIALAPWVLKILFAPEFSQAADLLRLQLFSDVFRLVGWTCAFVLLANRSSGSFFIGEAAWALTFVGFVIAGAQYGLEIIGIGYVVAYGVYSLVVVLLCRKATGFRFPRRALLVALGTVGAVYVVYLPAAGADEVVSALACGVALVLTALAGANLWRLMHHQIR